MIRSIGIEAFTNFRRPLAIGLNLNICVSQDFISASDATTAIVEDCVADSKTRKKKKKLEAIES